MRLPRIRLDFSFTIGDDDKPTDERYVDAMGHLQPSGDTDTFMGFTTPANDGESA